MCAAKTVNRIIAGILAIYAGAMPATGQTRSAVDSNFVHTFPSRNDVELYSGVYSTHFQFDKGDDRKHRFGLAVNSSAYIGVNVDYKWLSFRISTAMPGTQLDNKVKQKYTSLKFGFGSEKLQFRPFFDQYNGLLIPDGHRNTFTNFKDIRFYDAGLDMYYFFNSSRFSYRTANAFSELQTRSAGTWFAMVTPMWQRISWKKPSGGLVSDSATYKLLTAGPSWVSLLARVGYGYNFSLRNGLWMICPRVAVGGGALREVNRKNAGIQLASDLQAVISGGYNGNKYYMYMNAQWEKGQANLLIRNMTEKNTGVSLTMGLRFGNLEKKILGIL